VCSCGYIALNFVQLWLYSAELFVELQIFLTEGVEKIDIHILCSITLSKNHTIYEKMWKNIVQSDR